MEFTDNQRIEATFCFVDITGFTALTETRGDDAAADLVSLFVTLVNGAVGHRGTVLDYIGDAALVMCLEPSYAVEVVTELFRTSQQVPHFPSLRAGLHDGTVLRRDGRFFGTAINLASRVASQAQPGQVVATARVAQAAALQGISVRPLGTHALKNLLEPVELFALDVLHHLETTRVDPVCRATVRRSDAARILRFEDREFWFCSQECADRFVSEPHRYLPEPPQR